MARYISNNVCMDSVVKVAAPAGIVATAVGFVLKPIVKTVSKEIVKILNEKVEDLDNMVKSALLTEFEVKKNNNVDNTLKRGETVSPK